MVTFLDNNDKINIDNSIAEVDAITDELADKADDMQRQINVERARINTFTALGEGSTTGDAELADARVDKDGNTHANVGEHIRTVTNELNEKIVQLEDILYIEQSNVYEYVDLQFTTGKYYFRDKIGYPMVEQETSNSRFAIVELENGKSYKYEGGYPKANFPALVFFDDNNIARQIEYISTTNNEESFVYEFIADTSVATKLSINALSINYTTEPKLEVLTSVSKNKIEQIESSLEYIKDELKTPNQSYSLTMNSMSNGEYILSDEKLGLRVGARIVFTADITSFNKLYVGCTPSSVTNAMKYIGIDNENIYVYGNTNRIDETHSHGINIANTITVIIEADEDTKAKVTLLSNGSMFSKEIGYVTYPLVSIYALSEESTLANCKISWTCKDLNKRIWMFGDSYVDLYNVRWTYYLMQNGCLKNVLLSGVAGSTSADAYTSFENLLKHGTPRYALWCMGMNDGSDTDENTPSNAWKTSYDKFIEKCKELEIVPILATIPNVPQRTHIAKNKIVKESGYRYIDFAHIVGADYVGSNWYTDLLSDDNVHPSVQGARMLYGQALTDFPELMIEN